MGTRILDVLTSNVFLKRCSHNAVFWKATVSFLRCFIQSKFRVQYFVKGLKKVICVYLKTQFVQFIIVISWINSLFSFIIIFKLWNSLFWASVEYSKKVYGMSITRFWYCSLTFDCLCHQFCYRMFGISVINFTWSFHDVFLLCEPSNILSFYVK